ncbi:MAG TPA: toll/interleukin-1 receptor domain-containing protein [Ohtaekwangia sp.]
MVNIFISYSHQDVKYKEQLEKFLSPLTKNGSLNSWSDHKLKFGEEWDPEIEKAFNASHIILLLISSDFLSSDYISRKELPWALKKHSEKSAIIFPIYIRTCYLGAHKVITDIQGAPDKNKPVSSFEDKDAAYTLIVEQIAERIKDLPSFNESTYKKEAQQFKKEHVNESVSDLSRKDKIYLSVGSNAEQRKAIYSELSFRKQWESWPYTVIPDPKEAMELENLKGDDLQTRIQGYLDESLFSVHLIEDKQAAAKEIVSLQYTLARQRCSQPSFRCILAVNDKEAESTLLINKDEDHTTNPSIEKVSNWNRDVIITYIDKHIKESQGRIDELKRKSRPKLTVFLLYDFADEDCSTRDELKAELEAENVDVSPNVFHNYTDIDYNIRKYEAEQVKNCDGVVIFYARADHNWCKIRQDYVLKENVRMRGVCVDEPDVPTKIKRNVRRTQFVVINEKKELRKDVRDFVTRLREDHA